MEGLCKRRLNPFRWSVRSIRIFTVSFFLIMLPVYLYIGFQPAVSIKALSYPTLKIADINLSTPVAELELKDHQLIAPDTIAGSYSQNPNKTLIIGHSSTVFQQLENVMLETTFEYNGQEYQVNTIEILAKADISMDDILSTTAKPTIIIMTCAGEPLPNQDATHRLIITATAI